MSEKHQTLNQRIAELVNARGRSTAAALAKAVGCSRGYISKLQKESEINPSARVLTVIADFFGVSLTWLVNGTEPRETIRPATPVSGDQRALSAISTPDLITELARRHAALVSALESAWDENARLKSTQAQIQSPS